MAPPVESIRRPLLQPQKTRRGFAQAPYRSPTPLRKTAMLHVAVGRSLQTMREGIAPECACSFGCRICHFLKIVNKNPWLYCVSSLPTAVSLSASPATVGRSPSTITGRTPPVPPSHGRLITPPVGVTCCNDELGTRSSRSASVWVTEPPRLRISKSPRRTSLWTARCQCASRCAIQGAVRPGEGAPLRPRPCWEG